RRGRPGARAGGGAGRTVLGALHAPRAPAASRRAARRSALTSVPRPGGKSRRPTADDASKRAAPAAATRRAPSPAAVPWLWLAGVAGVAVGVYANSLSGSLLYDDVNAIRNNPFVRSGDVVGILTEPSWWGVVRGPLWRPLTTLTFALDHALHGLEPFGYHVVNVALHAVVSVLV